MGRLVKDASTTLVSAYEPAKAAIPAQPFLLVGCDLPKGWAYRALPGSVSAFGSWAPYYEVTPPGSTSTTVVTFVAIGDWDSYPYNPATQTFSLRVDGDGNLLGFWVTTTTRSGSPSPPRAYPFPDGMVLVSFEDTGSGIYSWRPAGTRVRGTIFIGYQAWIAEFQAASDGKMMQTTPWSYYDADVLAYVVDTGFVVNGRYGTSARGPIAGIPAVPAKSAVYETDYHIGWNAGARSIDVLDGDIRVVFEPAIVAAGAVGYAVAGQDIGNPASLSHAFYFDSDPETGLSRACVMEEGRRRSAYFSYAPGELFEITRTGAIGEVTYLFNGTPFQASATPLYGPQQVGTALYRAGDGVL